MMSGIEPDVVWVDFETLRRFMVDVFVGVGVCPRRTPLSAPMS